MSDKKTNNDITVIIPLYKADENLLKNAIESIYNQVVKPDYVMLVVGTDKDKELAIKIHDENGDLNIVTINHKESNDFATQLNIGVENCTTKWFIFLEQDDELGTKWVKNVIKYREVYSDTQIFLPIVLDVNEKGEFLGFTNHPVWASQFCDEMGVLDNSTMLRYDNFNIDGMAMLKEAYLEYGGFKPSMKLTFISEFLLRFTFNACKVMVVPNLGYKHLNNREGSLFDTYKKTLTSDESRWWLALAKKEYFYTGDRKISYEKNE